MYRILLKMYCSLFSAVANCAFNWSMVNFLRNKDKSLDMTVPTFKCDQIKRNRNMESRVWKYTMKSIVHSIWKEYGNYNMSLLMPE